jgi:DNA-binding MarR family transcriptional regulator
VERPGHFSEETYRDAAAFRVALRTFVGAAEGHARSAGLPPQQYALLLALRGHASYPEVSVKDMAEALQIRQSSASLLVDRAVKQGHVARVRSEHDRRLLRLYLTPSGQMMLDRVMAANRAELQQLDWGEVARILREALAVPAP